MLRCAELGLHTDDLAHMTMGMVYDMLTERANDREKYDLCPEPGSMKKFFAGGGKLG
ncbi:hypothetical protein MR657_10490 [bacterium]|nr:hypothetical protein [bacterium]